MSASIPTSMVEKFTTFGDFLRFLRRRAGITQLELSIAVGYSDAQISRLEQNLRLPDIPTIEARFVPALGLEGEPKAVARLLDLAANVRREDAPGLGLCPYKGLNYFDESDADLFSGREALTSTLVDRVLSLATRNGGIPERFLAIVGASGSGKSSLARAGLVPALRWNKTSANWLIHLFTPTAHPLESLAATLTQDAGSIAATAALMDDLGRDSRTLNLFVKRSLKLAGAAYLLLVVDQFEELFALCRSGEERSSFINNLIEAASQPDGQAIVVITLRADFYASCAGYPELREALVRQQMYIGAMSAEEMRRAVEEPARRGRWEFEPGLVELLLKDVGQEPGALPLLSHALLETWQRRRSRTLTLNGYISSGGVRGAIAETAEAVFADQFTREQQAIARRIFLRLTELGDETVTGDTRRRAAFNELILNQEEATAIQSVLKALADARLIITSENSVEVAHEALIREWPTLRGWLEDNREGLRLHRHLTDAAQEWLASEREHGGLYRGARLAQAREWAVTHADEMNTLECEFLEASQAWAEREAAERETQRQRELEAARRLAEAERQHAEAETQRAEEQARTAGQLRQRALYLAGALILALAMAFIALSLGAQTRRAAVAAQGQRRVAFSRELAAAAISNLEVDPERSILLALQAVTETYSSDKTWTAEAEDALRRGLQASRLELILRGHAGLVASVAFSPDGQRLATASDDGTAIVWDALTGQVVITLKTGANGGHHGMAFSPDGARLATAAERGVAKVWDAATGRELLALHGNTDWVSSVAFSPDGKRLATASEDRRVILWDAATGQELLAIRGHASEVWSVAFSPDGKRLATCSNERTAWVWDAVTGQKLLSLQGHQGVLNSITFSPEGSRLATASDDGTAKLWDAATGAEVLTLRGNIDAVAGVAFSPDGRRLATTSFDGKVKLWDALTGQELLTLPGHTGPVFGVAFSPDGRRLATTSMDGTARVWNASFSRELLTLAITSASTGAFSLDGTRLATGAMDGSVHVWKIPTALQDTNLGAAGGGLSGVELLNPSGRDGAVYGLAFSPDGANLATTGEDRSVKVWDLATGKKRLDLRGHTAAVYSLAFSPDGTRLVTSSSDYSIKTWDLKTGQVLYTLNTSASNPPVIFSPDGSRLAAGMPDGTARVWDAMNGKEQLVLRGHLKGIYGIAFSPDGIQLATASDDGTAKIWDAASGEELLTLTGHIGWVNSVTFSADGRLLATAGQDGTVRVWDATTGKPAFTLPSHDEPLIGVAFSSDGRRLVTISPSGVFRFYLLKIEDMVSLAQTRLTRSFTLEECQQYLHREHCSGAGE